MKTNAKDSRIPTGVRNLDQILSGGLPPGTLTVFAGTPGSGKTILSQQIAFKNATPQNRALFFQTLSEPTAKTLRYLQQFTHFDPMKLEDGSVQFVDLGEILRAEGLEKAIELLMTHIKRVKPSFVVIDSFKVFEDLAKSHEELRKFTYEVAINLMAWECTSLLLGEFSSDDIETNPLFSIVDGIFTLKSHSESGEQQRFIQVVKMRGTDHSRDEHAFSISSAGLEIYAPRLTIRRLPGTDAGNKEGGPHRAKLGISSIDKLLDPGIPYGSSLLVSGAAGTGKTLLSLELIYRGATELGEKGLFISFEETPERLIAAGQGMGWDLAAEVRKGNIEIMFVPQTEILVEEHLVMMKARIDRLQPKRIAIDSVSVFVHKITNPRAVREKIFQLATLVQSAQAIGFFVTDIPYGSRGISRFGLEETVVDGVILLTSVENGLARERYVEIYKLRNTAHASGRHRMSIEHDGVKVMPGALSTVRPTVRPNGAKTKVKPKRAVKRRK